MPEYGGRRTTTQEPGHAAPGTQTAAPGKRTLVEQAQAAPVQQRANGADASDGAVHAAAATGVATPSSALPHGDTIQRAFGRHDLSAVQAHTGSDAAASAQAMGAQAYATGNHVVLGAGTDLHTVAHEAAHVVQQRGGVQLKGGIGEVGDAHEQHADAVADAVVQGKSAESLLSQATGHPAAPSQTPSTVQLLRTKADNADVDIAALPLVRVFDLLRRKDPDPDLGGFHFDAGDREKLDARGKALLPAAFQQLINAQASGADTGVMTARNIKTSPADQQKLIRFMQQMATEGVVSGLDQWMAYVSAHAADSTAHAENRQDHMNELKEAARRILQGAKHVDLSESEIGGTGQTADLKIGATQVEVKTVREPIRGAADLTNQLAAGLAKFAAAPAGQYEVTIFGSIDESLFGGGKVKGGKSPSTTVADPDALTITTTRTHPKTNAVVHTQVKRLIDDLITYLDGAPTGADKVGKVTIIMENAGSYQATKHAAGHWQGAPL